MDFIRRLIHGDLHSIECIARKTRDDARLAIRERANEGDGEFFFRKILQLLVELVKIRLTVYPQRGEFLKHLLNRLVAGFCRHILHDNILLSASTVYNEAASAP